MHEPQTQARTPSQPRALAGSYADFITLLFAFFVVMYATAQVDKQKMGHLATAIQQAFEQMGALPANAPVAIVEPPRPTPAQTVARNFHARP